MREGNESSGDRRERLEEVLGEYLDRRTRGEEVDPAEVLSEHPDFAAEILQELETFDELGADGEPAQALGTLGDYRLLRQVGCGGMGVVYEAWQSSMDRPVALKVLPAGLAADTKALTRFVREAQVAGKLHHPNVVSVFCPCSGVTG